VPGVLVVGTLMGAVAGMGAVILPLGGSVARLEVLPWGLRLRLLGMFRIPGLRRGVLGRGMMVPVMVAMRVVHQSLPRRRAVSACEVSAAASTVVIT
jgi:hypothetical protein